ncbi:MAG TPA: adenosylcobinamide-phosphate synthase CbiB [Verrucomicrobiae bacterium]|nr:adenosylcobinamide-phosphate synthase CbiB [Verrucomicrobiae bacterium]
MIDFAWILLLAALLDAAFGDPVWLYRAVPHPAALIGRLIGWLDRRFNDPVDPEARRKRNGVIAVAALTAGAWMLGQELDDILRPGLIGQAIEVILASSLIAQRSLYDHVAAVASALAKDGLSAGRAAVARIVGRDTAELDEAGVSRAALESLAENLSDAVTAPLFWGLIFGLPGLIVYKVINTADSMIGHRTPRHESFGWAAARFDDLLNLVPARLCGAVIVVAAVFVRGADSRRGWQAMWRDAPKHRSPNAGWPEAALAGALGFAIAGPRRYHGVEESGAAYMGAGGRSNLTADDIRQGLRLFIAACALQLGIVAAIALL